MRHIFTELHLFLTGIVFIRTDRPTHRETHRETDSQTDRITDRRRKKLYLFTT